MRSQIMGLRRKHKTWLHLILVVGMFVYLYSPLFDHWIGNETYARPHTHIHVENIFALDHLADTDTDAHASEHGEHEEGVLCLLDINALFSVVLFFNAAPSGCANPNTPLIFDLLPAYRQVSAIYLSSLDPPPRI